MFIHDYVNDSSGKFKRKNKFGFDEALEKTRLASLIGGKERAENFLKRIKEHAGEIEINDLDSYLECNDRIPKYGNTRLINLSPVKISSWDFWG